MNKFQIVTKNNLDRLPPRSKKFFENFLDEPEVKTLFKYNFEEKKLMCCLCYSSNAKSNKNGICRQ